MVSLKRGDRGPLVYAAQVKLVALGYPLPRWGTDGRLGTETLDAFALFMRDHAAEADEDRTTIDDTELTLLDQVHVAKAATELPPNLIDLRTRSSRKWDRGARTWKDTYGITLHQTACFLAENDERMLGVGAHVVIGRAGQVWWLHDFDRLIVHGNGFNTHCVGIEMNGLYAGVEGDPSTVWDDPSTARHEQAMAVTRELVLAAHDVVRWICRTVAAHGGKVRSLVAHRQASENRRDDPGSALWQVVGLPMLAEQGLSDGGPGFKIGTGLAIPEAWDASRVGVRY